ncbi:membrane protein [Rugosimonospora africana]|uniref:Membrane protein n=1 Tax=Rugosimonospora africana TaxID=556532 RepID=A0A8J3QPU3_9ACTN|nr:membrane protein [Rugosimonospora africana]
MTVTGPHDDGSAGRRRMRGAWHASRRALVASRRAVAPPLRAAVRVADRPRMWRRLGLALALVVTSLVGVTIGLLVAGPSHDDVGPFAAQFSLTPSLSGGTEVQIPPLGSLELASHDGPAHLTVRLEALDQKRTLALATDPNGIAKASSGAVNDVERGITRMVFQATGAGVLGALVLSAFVFRNMKRVAICGALALVTILGSGGIAVATFRPGSVDEPRYHGLLSNAPAVIGDAKQIANQFGQYRDELQRLVNNVSKLYGTLSTLPVYQPAPGSLRVLHISDLHLNPAAWSVISTVVKQYDINLVVDTGDIDDWGTQVEASFVNSIGALKIPYVFVRGNHDSGTTADAVAKQSNAIVLENRIVTVDGLTIAGIGDPQFTPDKEPGPSGAAGHQAAEVQEASGEKLAQTIRNAGKPVDVAMVHEPASAGALDGLVPLVLAGHIHHRDVSTMPQLTGQQKTALMVEGSTGGAGLRGLEGEAPTPLEMSVLYFDPTHALQGYDDITLGGTGQTEVTIQRHVVKAPPSGSPSGSPNPSRS